MKTLEACYELDFSKIEFLERKQRITHPKTLLFGPSHSGKSYLIFDYLSNFQHKEYLYINFEDTRNDKEEIKLHLQNFIHEYSISVLVLENFEFDIDIPQCDSIIITSKQHKHLTGFKQLDLMPLDFEEFLLHDNKHQTPTQAFNNFLKYGNLPEIIALEEHKKIQRLQEIIQLYSHSATQQYILKLLFEAIDEKKSLHQLFTQMKKEHKISKDKFYEYCKTFEQEQIIFFIEKYQQKKAIKKIYSYNHAFLTTVSHHKKFKNEFTNMVFLELVHKYEAIYYLDYIDFYLPTQHTIIMVLPFFNALLINTIKKRVLQAVEQYHIDTIFIITVGNSDTITLQNKKIQVLPFYEWALLN